MACPLRPAAYVAYTIASEDDSHLIYGFLAGDRSPFAALPEHIKDMIRAELVRQAQVPLFFTVPSNAVVGNWNVDGVNLTATWTAATTAGSTGTNNVLFVPLTVMPVDIED